MLFEAISDEKGLLLGAARSWLLAQIARICGVPAEALLRDAAGSATAEAAALAPPPTRNSDGVITQTLADARLLVAHGADVDRVAETTGVPAEELRPFAVPADVAAMLRRDDGPGDLGPEVDDAVPGPLTLTDAPLRDVAGAVVPSRLPPGGREARRGEAERAVLAACTTEGRLLADVRAVARDASGLAQGAIQTAIERLEADGRVRRFGGKHARMIHLLAAAERQLVKPAPEPQTEEDRDRRARERQADQVRQASDRRQQAATALDARRQAIRLVLKPLIDTGRLFALSHLATAATAEVEGAEIEDVRVVLTEWVRAGQIGGSTIGLERRYRKRGDVEAIAL